MMDVLSKIFLWVLYASISASAISLLIILLERLFRKKLGVRIHHALWILVLIRLLVPVMPGSPINLFNLIPEDVQHILDFTKNTVSTTSADAFEKRAYLSNLPADPLADAAINNQPMKISAVPESEALQEGVKWSIPEIASIVWVTGLFSIALFYIIITMSFYKSIIMSRKPADKEIVSLLESCMIKAKQRKRIAVYTEKGLKSPCISGIFKTAIYLPEGILEAIDHQQLSNVLLHELAHHKRKDVLFNLLGTVAVIVHWFNPIVWICVKRMKFVGELACDAYVLEMLGEEKNIHYGETIINLSKLYLNSPGKLTLVSFFETKNQIEKRITMIKRFRKNNYKITAA
ncbi:MAG: M56 family metallopeptidase, partial [Clostridia bacterium]|nr:M56 family metallopeptidase [Clostridia bacterium]